MNFNKGIMVVRYDMLGYWALHFACFIFIPPTVSIHPNDRQNFPSPYQLLDFIPFEGIYSLFWSDLAKSVVIINLCYDVIITALATY